MKLANQLIQMYESKHLKDVNTAKLTSKLGTKDTDLECSAKFVFDLKAMANFPIDKETDIDSWVDDVISNADVEDIIEKLVNKEVLKHTWFTSKFDAVEVEIDGVDHGGKIENLNAVAIAVKLIFKARIYLMEGQVNPVLNQVMPTLTAELAKAASKLDASRYKG